MGRIGATTFIDISAYAREGAKVIIADVNIEGSEETVRLIGNAGGEALFVRCDVGHAESVRGSCRARSRER